MKFTRKDRFVLAAAAAMGFGNMLVPKWATYLFEPVESPNDGLRGLFNSIVIVLSTPCKSLLTLSLLTFATAARASC